MPVPDASFSRRYGGREDTSSYSTYSASRTTPSRASYLYNSKLSSTLPPRPSYERKISESGMPVSRFLPSSSTTGLPRSSANYISTTTSSTRNLSPIRNSVVNYRSAFEGTPSVTDRIKSLEVSALDGTGRSPTTSRFLQKVREQREASSKPNSSSYSNSSSRDRSGSREYGSLPLATSGMILRDRFGSENAHQNSGDRAANKFESRIRAASVMGRSSPPSQSYLRNGYSHLDTTEVTPSYSSDTSTTTTTSSTTPSSKSVPIVVASNNAITSNNAAVVAAGKGVENGVANFNDDGQCDSSVVENGNSSEVVAESTADAVHSNIIKVIDNSLSSKSEEPKNESELKSNVLVGNVRRSSKSNLFDAKTLASASSGSYSPEKDSNGNTIIPVVLEEKSAIGEKVNSFRRRESSNSLTKAQKNGHNENNVATKKDSANERIINTTKNQTMAISNGVPSSLKTRGSSATQSSAEIRTPKVIYHTIKIEDNENDNESLHHKQSSPPAAGTNFQKPTSKLKDTESNNVHHLSNGNVTPPLTTKTNNTNEPEEITEKAATNNNDENQTESGKFLPNLVSKEKSTDSSSSTCGLSGVGKNSLGRVKQLIRSSKSRSPSPAPNSAPPSLSQQQHVLPSISNNSLLNGGGSNHVDEMEGPHASKHLNGGMTIRGMHTTELPSTSSSFEPASSSPGGGGGGRAAATYDSSSSGSASSSAAAGSRTKNNYNNSSDSSDNDSDSSSPNLGGGRFRTTNRDKEKGLSGLRNIGNTCFMNSVLQCLSNTKPLLEYVLKDNYSADITTTSSMHGLLMRAFASVIHELWSDSKSVVDTSAFKDQIQRFAPRFMGYSQQDAQEFLRYLLEGLHEDVNRVTTKPKPISTDIDDSLSDAQKATEAWKRYLRSDDSKIVDLFVGQLKSTLKCTTCGHCSVTFDPFWDLSLPIPSKSGQTRLSQCLELFSREEILDGDEKPTCSKCQAKRKCTKSFSIQKFPKILVIHLKRFSQLERYRGKLSTTVDFPLNGLDMTPYAANRSLGCTYNLYGVSNHSGSTYSGHYIAYGKHPYSGEWYCYNDSRVSPISTHSVVSSEGYLLFYELAGQSSHL